MHTKYILASSSKSRYKILKNSGLVFKHIKPKSDEEKLKIIYKKKNYKPYQIAKHLSFEKAKSISVLHKYYNHTVIGCDTLIYIGNKIYDKAKNIKEAKIKLKNLSGKNHKIVSGLTVCIQGKKVWQTSVTTEVKLRSLKSTDINKYLKKTGLQILSSVGCYQIESLGPLVVEGIKGDLFNVMGLPLFKLLNYISENK